MGIYGDVGSGKTILDVYFAIQPIYKKVYANFKMFNLKSYRPLKIEELFNPEPENVITLTSFDEGYTLIESRTSLDKINRYISYAIFQCRKRNKDFISTAQLKSSLDLRFKDMERMTVYAFPRDEKSTEDFNYAFITDYNIKYFQLGYKFAKKYLFDKYDTNEILMPHDFAELQEEIILENPKKLKEKIEQVIVKINNSNLSLPKITHDSVLDLLLQLEEPRGLEPFLYSRLKTKELLKGGD
jgi:hypothetical protein